MQNPLAPLDVLATNEMFRDPALADLSEAELAEYRATRDLDAIRARLPESPKPTVFVVKRLPPVSTAGMEGMSRSFRELLAFLQACHCVVLPDGAPLEPDRKKMSKAAGGVSQADDEWFNRIAARFGVETCYEIGRVAFEWARLPESAKGPFT